VKHLVLSIGVNWDWPI